MGAPVQVVLIIAAIAYVLVRRLLGEPVVGKRLLLVPAVLTVIGLAQVSVHSASAVVVLVIGTMISVVFGLLRGWTVRMYEQNGIVMLRYRTTTIVLWIASIAVRLGGGLLVGSVDPGAAQTFSSGLMLAVGAGLLAEGLVLVARAVRVPGQIVWSKGRRGGAHQTSPLLESWQQKVHGVGNGHDSSR